MEQHRLSREQSGAGNCPFLREPCLNIRAKGMNSLGAYFDDLLAEDERALVPLRAQRDELTPRSRRAQGAALLRAIHRSTKSRTRRRRRAGELETA